MIFGNVGLDYADPKKKNNYLGKFLLTASLTALCIFMLKQSPTFNTPSVVQLLTLLCSEFFIGPDETLLEFLNGSLILCVSVFYT